MAPKILITGASGQLGRCVCVLLSHAGMPFIAVDKVPDSEVSYPVELVDLLDQNICQSLVEGVTVVAHFANHPNWYSGSPQQVYGDNVRMNMNLFQAAADAGCKRIVFSSSIQLLNGHLPSYDREEQDILLPYLPMDSDMPNSPRNAYALSKQASENMLRYFSKTRNMTCISIRYPWLLNADLLKKAMDQGGIKRGKCHDGYAYLPIYAGAELAILAMTAPISGYRQYFVASHDNLEQRPAREVIEEQLSHIPLNKALEDMDSLVDCSKVEQELAWQQPQSLEESFHRYVPLENLQA